MKLETPKQLFIDSMTYYVSSESNPDEKHIVVKSQGTFFCDCRDFFIRHLPLFGTSAFELCKHGKFMRDSTDIVFKNVVFQNTTATTPTPKFGVFFYSFSFPDGVRSSGIPRTFDSREEAEDAIKRGGTYWYLSNGTSLKVVKLP